MNDLVNSILAAGKDIYEEIDEIIGSDTTFVDYAESVWGIVKSAYQIAGALIHDDLVGVTSKLSPSGCYPTLSGPVQYQLRDEDDDAISSYIKVDDNLRYRQKLWNGVI